jgi:hypothetical protein
VNELVLQRAEERLCHGIIVADPGAADRLAQVERGEGIGELCRRVVAAPVGVEIAVGTALAGGPYRDRRNVLTQALPTTPVSFPSRTPK